MRATLAMVALWAACGGSTPPAPSNTAETTPAVARPEPAEPPVARGDRQAVELAIHLIGEMAGAAGQAPGMCDQVGASIAAIATANEDVFTQLAAISSDPARAAVIEEHRPGLDEALGALAAQIGDCGGHPAVGAAMDAMAVH